VPTITCRCDKEIEYEIPELVELTGNSDLQKEVLEGRFLTVECDTCGERLKPAFTSRFIDEDNNFRCVLVPETQYDHVLTGEITIPEDFHVAIGYHELVEKYKIHRTGFEEEKIEYFKYLLISSAPKNIGTPTILFNQFTDGVIEFYVTGVKSDEIGIMKIPEERYKNIVVDEDIMEAIRERPYISVKKLHIESEDSEIENQDEHRNIVNE
jgi:hypothetical protein